MLKQRIISTLNFFNLADTPLTLLEIHKFLTIEPAEIKADLNSQWEIVELSGNKNQPEFSPDQILQCLTTECQAEVESLNGFYFLAGRKAIAQQRQLNYLFGIKRERKIRRFVWLLKYFPFVRGVAIGGSQALGPQRENSDIDLFIITDAKFLWLPRTLVTAYFQILGNRRHGKLIANRFCLNHYVAGAHQVSQEKDMYRAKEYVSLRPVVYKNEISHFLHLNSSWLKKFFPQYPEHQLLPEKTSAFQKLLEQLFANNFGRSLEKRLGRWQLRRIRSGEFMVADESELSFHSKDRKLILLAKYFNGK